MDIDEIELRTFPISRRGYDRADVDAFLTSIAAEYRRTQAEYRQAVQTAKDAARSAAAAAAASNSPSFENVGSQVATILATASQAAETLRAEAEQDSDAIRKVAEEQAAELNQAAVAEMTEAQDLRAKAEQEVYNLRAIAEADADEIVAQAHSQAAQVEQETKERAARADRVARAKIETIVTEGRREYEHLRSLSQQMIDRISSVEFLIQQARDGISGHPSAVGERVGPLPKDAEMARILGSDDIRNG